MTNPRVSRLPVAIALLIAAALAASCNRQEVDTLGVKVNLTQDKLSNGLTLIMVEDHTVPIVSYQTWFRVGSVDEQPGITGISHLFEHLMFKGTPKYGPKEFFLQLEAKGAEVNAFTTRDYTVYYENFVPPMLEKAMDMESDRMSNLKLDDDVLNSERLVVLEERRLRSENVPEGKIQEALWALAYNVHPYQWPVIGYPQDLLSMTTAKLQDWYHNHYSPSNATLVIVGDIDPAKTEAMVKKYYGPVPGVAIPKRKIAAEPEQNEERRFVIRDKVASERLAQAYHVTSAEQDDSYALDVLANILFEGTSSRAYRRLVEEKDIMTGVSGSAYTPTYPGLFIIMGTMRAGLRAQNAEHELEQVIEGVQSGGVTDDEVHIAVRQLTVQLVDSVRTPYGLGQLIGTVQTIFGDPKRFAEDLAKYTKVTPADVKRVAIKYLTPNNRSVVVMAPEPTDTQTAQAEHTSFVGSVKGVRR